MTSRIRRATPADLPAIRALRLEAGWEAHDWALLDAMRAPHAAFFAIDERLGEEAVRVVAIGSGIAYGRLGVVGNMVVAPDRYRLGLGSMVLRAILDFLEERGVRRIELFATSAGRLLYQRFGFSALAPASVARLQAASARRSRADGVAVRTAGPEDLDAVAGFDRPRFGADRRPILESALRDAGRPAFLALRDGAISGFCVLRPAGARLGPWVADDAPAAAALLGAAARMVTPETVLTSHLPGENAEGRAWLLVHGAEVSDGDARMARGAAIAGRPETILGIALGALG